MQAGQVCCQAGLVEQNGSHPHPVPRQQARSPFQGTLVKGFLVLSRLWTLARLNLAYSSEITTMFPHFKDEETKA